MKVCPQCKTSYTDDSLQFCLQDGAPLDSQTASGNWSESETLVSPAQYDKVRIDLQDSPSEKSRTSTYEPVIVEPPKKSNTALVVALTALLTIIGVGAVTVAVMYNMRDKDPEIAQNTNSRRANAVVPNANQKSNVNSVANTSPTPTPTATPVPSPTLAPKEAENIKSSISDMIKDWKEATEDADFSAQLDNYADTVDYYISGKVDINTVRSDKQRAFEAYNNIKMDISNMKITLDETGEKAIAVFDKEWKFEGDGGRSEGKVQQQLQLGKINGKWRITGERDLRVYYQR